MRAFVAVVLVTGCGFQVTTSGVPDDARVDAGDAPGDVPPDGPPTCMDRWLAGTIRFQPAVPLTSVSSTSYDRDPYVTRDELTLYTSTGRNGGTTGADIYIATRASASDAFGTPTRNVSASTTEADTKLSIVADGQTAFIGSGRPNGNNNIDVWEATYTSGTFGGFTQMHVAAVNSGANEHDPFISANGLHLYLAPDGGGSPQRIVVASRTNVSGNFSAPVRIDELYSGDGDADPTLSDDERVIVFASQHSDAHAGGNLWFSTRASPSGTFAAPVAVPDLNTDADEGDPHLSVDGCRLYFGRFVQGSDWDLFVAEATAP